MFGVHIYTRFKVMSKYKSNDELAHIQNDAISVKYCIVQIEILEIIFLDDIITIMHAIYSNAVNYISKLFHFIWQINEKI